MQKILLLSGKAGSGKDTVGNLLVGMGNWIKIGFADCLKNEASLLYGIPKHMFYSQEGKMSINQYNVTNRDVLIRHGMNMRKKDPYYWTNKVIEFIISKSKDKNVVITDFRFPDEYSRLSKFFRNLKTARIHRDVKLIDSPSEKMLDDFSFDFHIYNNSNGKEHLIRQIKSNSYLTIV